MSRILCRAHSSWNRSELPRTPSASENQDVGFGGPSADTRRLKGAGLGLEQERAAARQLAPKGARGQVDQETLIADGRIAAVIEMVGQGQLVGRPGMGRQGRVSLTNRERPLDDQSRAGLALVDRAGFVERFDEDPARSVASRAFDGIDLDEAVVDP